MTGGDDWYGERSEDRTHHSVVTEARPYDSIGQQRPRAEQQRPRIEPASVNDSTSIGRQRPDVDHVYSRSVIYINSISRRQTMDKHGVNVK